MGPDTPAIEVRALRRTYRASTGLLRRRVINVEALRGIDFTVEQGELFGLLGPNGAGKTTTIKILITLLLPTAGEARILGRDVVADAHVIRRYIGYVFGGERGLYERLSAIDNLRYFAELYGVEPRRQKQRIAELLDLVGLRGRERERVEGYSRGMRQRLHIARGLVHDPPLLFLDEPTIGVDPVGARELRDLIASLVEAGKTVLLTTHYMFEADALCNRIAVIARGRIVDQGTPQELKQRVAGHAVIEVEAFGLTPAVLAQVEQLAPVTALAVAERDHSQVISVQVTDPSLATPLVLACLEGATIGRVTTREPTLEDAYVALVSKQ